MTYCIHTNEKNYNPHRSYFQNQNKHARTFYAETPEEVEKIKAQAIARGAEIRGIYIEETGKRVG